MPIHLRNAPTKLMKELGYGHEYRYAHDEPDAYAAGETYFPDDLRAQHWYRPVPRGLEGKIGEKLNWLKSLDAEWRRANTKGRGADAPAKSSGAGAMPSGKPAPAEPSDDESA